MCAAASEVAASGYEYISPVPGSRGNTRESTIIIRHGSDINARSLQTPGLLTVEGSVSGAVRGELLLARDGKTVIFKPQRPFAAGERVRVRLAEGLRTTTGRVLPATRFSFGVSTLARVARLPEAVTSSNTAQRPGAAAALGKAARDGAMPEITTNVYDADAIGDGYVFVAVAAEVEGIGYYLLVLDNDGQAVKAKQLMDDYAYDFKVQENGLLTYAQFLEHHSYTGGGNVVHMVMDQNLDIIDSVQMGNGYIAEAHDFQMLPNGHYLLFGYYLTPVDMSKYVDGGKPNALVSGGVVQELDADKNVVFQWRSWDAYDFEDYQWGRFATRDIVSEFHLNTINMDIDGNLFLGTPSWSKKLNRRTGEIMYHLGGDENEFSFVGVDSTDAVGHFGGHYIHRIPNGNVLIYDNGDRQGNNSSQVHEYTLDEENRIATHVWTWVPEEKISGWHRGNAQRLPNGNTVIGWGGGRGELNPTCTEVAPDGSVVFEMFFDNPAVESYRAFRFPLPDGQPCADVTEYEVSPGLDYDFVDGEENDTGVRVAIDSIGGSGYNEMNLKKYCFAPLYPVFTERAPRVIPRHLEFAQYNISGIKATLHFDVTKWEIDDAENTTVYWRADYGSGLFTPVPTTYNRVTGMVIAEVMAFGEYILATPDVDVEVFTPVPFAPAQQASVNEKLPVTLRWSPVGFVSSYQLQVSKENHFGTLLVDAQNLTEALYTIPALDPGETYYWRVKAVNDAGESPWSSIQIFTATAPYVTLDTPNGGEQWQLGLDYWIRWEDNIEEEVTVALYRDDVFVEDLATTASNGAWEWSIPTDLETGDDYRIRITGMDGDAVTDISKQMFSIIDTTTAVTPLTALGGFALDQNYPNPVGARAVTHIGVTLPRRADVTLRLHDMQGRVLRTVPTVTMDAGTHVLGLSLEGLPNASYFYTLETPAGTLLRPLTVVR
jgi:hypothetical protein